MSKFKQLLLILTLATTLIGAGCSSQQNNISINNPPQTNRSSTTTAPVYTPQTPQEKYDYEMEGRILNQGKPNHKLVPFQSEPPSTKFYTESLLVNAVSSSPY